MLPDNITTNHLSPSNAIMPDSAAGEYLATMGCQKKTSTLCNAPGRPSDRPAPHWPIQNCLMKWSMTTTEMSDRFPGKNRA